MPYITTKDNTKLYYEDRPAKNKDAKNDETLLIIHGLGSSHFDIAEFIDTLNEEYRVVFYDQRGHGSSDHPQIHLNVKTLGQDLNEVIEKLDLNNITGIGHSMGAAALFSYIGQYGTDRLKRLVIVDMSPYLRNDGWEGGIGKGTWTDENFMEDLDRIFNDPGEGSFYIVKHLMNPNVKALPEEEQAKLLDAFRENTDPLVFASLWYSLFRTDQRPVMDKIDVPVLYLMPEIALYSTVNTDYISNHVQSSFTLVDDFPETTHLLLQEKPKEAAEVVEKFIQSTN